VGVQVKPTHTWVKWVFLVNTSSLHIWWHHLPNLLQPIWVLKGDGFSAHVPTCTILNASFLSWCNVGIMCCVECHSIRDYTHCSTYNISCHYNGNTMLRMHSIKKKSRGATCMDIATSSTMYMHNILWWPLSILKKTLLWGLHLVMPCTHTQMMDVNIFLPSGKGILR
jgi:hypothetical protein